MCGIICSVPRMGPMLQASLELLRTSAPKMPHIRGEAYSRKSLPCPVQSDSHIRLDGCPDDLLERADRAEERAKKLACAVELLVGERLSCPESSLVFSQSNECGQRPAMMDRQLSEVTPLIVVDNYIHHSDTDMPKIIEKPARHQPVVCAQSYSSFEEVPRTGIVLHKC
jgi:hypothetical protein